MVTMEINDLLHTISLKCPISFSTIDLLLNANLMKLILKSYWFIVHVTFVIHVYIRRYESLQLLHYSASFYVILLTHFAVSSSDALLSIELANVHLTVTSFFYKHIIILILIICMYIGNTKNGFQECNCLYAFNWL